jgi:AcrR family transcriptional regulator
MDTKHKILDEALTLFSERGYANVYVNDIAERVGIKAPSLYKHYKNKRAIFDAILDEMNKKFTGQAAALNISGTEPAVDAGIYENMSEEDLLKLGRELFLFYLHDDYNRRFRKMLTIEQFSNPDLAKVYMDIYVDKPLSYQGMLLGMIAKCGMLHTDNVEIMTLHFYAPIYMLLTVCDRNPAREKESLKLLDAHIKQFNHIYGRTKK